MAAQANPRNIELLKPVAMLAVITASVIAMFVLFQNSATSDAATSSLWKFIAASFAFWLGLPTLLYLVEVRQNLQTGDTKNELKRATAFIITLMLVSTAAIFTFMQNSGGSEVTNALVLLIASAVIMTTMLVMGAVEGHLIKTTAARADADGLDERVRLTLEKELEGIR